MNNDIEFNITLFGATGDLSYRKLFPALYNLFTRDKLNEKIKIVAIGRRTLTTEDYLAIVKVWVEKFSRFDFDDIKFKRFGQLVNYVVMDFTDATEYRKLSTLFCKNNIKNNLFYLAVAPEFFEIIAHGLSTIDCRGNSRVVLEKPFGATLEEAAKLNQTLENFFGDSNIFRIDHYLGKEMVRSILTMRTANPMFLRCWDKNSIDHVNIYAGEEIGVESRGGYYDKAGAVKDMVQNHLMQILSLVAMELPQDIKNVTAVREKQIEVLRQLRPIENLDVKESLVMGQYVGYREEPKVAPDSQTETYAQCRLFVDNDRWENVPFIITSGKKLATRLMEVTIVFRSLNDTEPNRLTFQVQPREGVVFRFNIKDPGESNTVTAVEMDFCQSCVLAYHNNTPEAYERLLDSAMQGNQTWFSTWPQIELSWRYLERLKELYRKEGLPLLEYANGSVGP